MAFAGLEQKIGNQMSRDFYAGIGSRKTPKPILEEMEQIGAILARNNFILRSGAADGADSAFEKGVDSVNGPKEIFLPWENFNGHLSGYHAPWKRAFEMAEEVIPWWDNLTEGTKKLHARNVHQILGLSLNEPVEFVVCWTPDGQTVGGTATAIKIARKNQIPVINLATNRRWSPLNAFAVGE